MGSLTLPIFLYDGECGFCSACARFVQHWIPTSAAVEAWQLIDIESLGLTVADCEEAVQWVASPTEHTSGPAAIAVLLKASRPWWRAVGWVLGSRPVLAMAWSAYRWVSRNRGWFPGGTPTCALSHADQDRVH
jgi:hypothetical protein